MATSIFDVARMASKRNRHVTSVIPDANRKAIQIVLGVLVASMCLATMLPAQVIGEDFIGVGVQVVVYRNATVTRNQANEVLNSANTVFSNAKAGLQVHMTRFVDDEPAPNGTNSECNDADRQKIYKNGLAVLKDFTKKRLMLNFVEKPNVNNGEVIGFCGENLPVSIVSLRGSTKDTGETAAHEFCHSFGLDDINDKTNLMHERAGGELGLTAEQIQKIHARAKPYHDAPKKKESKTEPATPKQKSSGLQFDPDSTNPNAPAHFNIAFAGISADEGDPDYDVTIVLMGLIPAPGAAGSYRLLFDTDSDSMTGVTISGHSGIEKAIRVDTFASGLILFRLQDLVLGTFTSVSGSRVSLVGNMDFAYPPIDVPEYDAFFLTVPKSMLNLIGGRFYDVPVVALQGPALSDDFFFTLDTSAELIGPQLSTATGQIGPGPSVLTLVGTGFTPNALVDLSANHLLMDTVMTDSGGGFTTEVSVPECTPADVVYLWGIETATADDAFTVVHRIPTACDVNCDGALNLSDIPPFVNLILGLSGPCSPCAGDANSDGLADGRDIDLLVDFVLGQPA